MEKLEREITETIVPAIISELILEEKITENSNDKEVKQAITSYLHSGQLDLMNVAITMGNEFEKAIENAINLGQNDVAIALAGICFEQITNQFYQKILLNKYKFSRSEYESCMKGISVKYKLTWLYKLTAFKCMDPNVVSDVCKICSLRNNIVHYKPKVEKIGEQGTDGDNDNESYNVSKILPLIERIKEIFSEDTDNLLPEEKMSKDIFRKIFGKEKIEFYIDSKE